MTSGRRPEHGGREVWSPDRGGIEMNEQPSAQVATSKWIELTRANPGHSSWYIERFRSMAAAGDDLDGEARLVDAMAARQSRILDAGCGPGRVGAALADRGHSVVGVDVDPELIAAAEQAFGHCREVDVLQEVGDGRLAVCDRRQVHHVPLVGGKRTRG